jgi:DNA segregation ATPase FtsK/SpoIIIE-like protein
MTERDFYAEAVEFTKARRDVSVGALQHGLHIKYGWALTYIEKMKEEGIISEPTAQGKMKVLKRNKAKPQYTAAELLGSG